MPRLNLLAEDCHDAVAVLFEEGFAQAGCVYGFEELLAEGADVVEV